MASMLLIICQRVTSLSYDCHICVAFTIPYFMSETSGSIYSNIFFTYEEEGSINFIKVF